MKRLFSRFFGYIYNNYVKTVDLSALSDVLASVVSVEVSSHVNVSANNWRWLKLLR